MHSLTTSLARRGLEAVHSTFADGQDGHEPVRIPASAMFLVFITCLIFGVLLFTISYTYGNVAATLTMIESPETNTYVAVDTLPSSQDADSSPPAYTDTNTPKPHLNDRQSDPEPDLLLVKARPITSSLRSTIRHLRSRAGYRSGFRGLSLFIVWGVVRGMISGGLSAIPFLHNRLGVALTSIIAEVILARWHMTWIHIVISEPSPKRWYQRLPPLKSWKNVAPAVALQAACTQIASGLPTLIGGSFGAMKHFKDPAFEPGKKDVYAAFGQSLMVLLIMAALFVLLVIPATVTLVRVAASMLPEEDEAIVPFDRTFGGRVTPEIIGGKGKVGMVEAWKSFPWAGRVRLVKLLGKVFVIIVSVWVLFLMVLSAEAHMLLGDKLGEMMKAIGGQMGH